MTRLDLGLEPATSCVAIGYSNYLAIDQKEKLIKNLKKQLTRLRFEPPTPCVADG